MKNKFVFLALLLFVVASCKKEDDTQQTQTVNLQLDGYTTGSTAAFQGGFVTGETSGVTLGPVTNTFQVTCVKFFFGGPGIPTSRDVILKIYKDTGAGNPGTLLFSSTYTLASSDITLHSLTSAMSILW